MNKIIKAMRVSSCKTCPNYESIIDGEICKKSKNWLSLEKGQKIDKNCPLPNEEKGKGKKDSNLYDEEREACLYNALNIVKSQIRHKNTEVISFIDKVQELISGKTDTRSVNDMLNRYSQKVYMDIIQRQDCFMKTGHAPTEIYIPKWQIDLLTYVSRNGPYGIAAQFDGKKRALVTIFGMKVIESKNDGEIFMKAEIKED